MTLINNNEYYKQITGFKNGEINIDFDKKDACKNKKFLYAYCIDNDDWNTTLGSLEDCIKAYYFAVNSYRKAVVFSLNIGGVVTFYLNTIFYELDENNVPIRIFDSICFDNKKFFMTKISSIKASIPKNFDYSTITVNNVDK